MNNDSQQKPFTTPRHDHAVLVLGMVAAGNMDVECAYDALVSMLATSPAAIQRGDGQTTKEFVERNEFNSEQEKLRNPPADKPRAATPNETAGATPDFHEDLLAQLTRLRGWLKNNQPFMAHTVEDAIEALRELNTVRAASTK